MPVAVDTGFADLFDTASPAFDPFDFAEAPQASPSTDTQFDGVDWVADPPPSLRPEPAATAEAAAVAELHSVVLKPVPRMPLATSAQFHAWAPATVVPGSTVAIDLWVALPAQAADVARQARQASDLPAPAAVMEAGTPVVTLQLRIDGLLPAAPTQRLAWLVRPERVRFMVPVPMRASVGAHAARIKLAVGGLPIGELSFVLNVLPNAASGAPLEDTHAARRMLQSAYAAYAHTDRDEVLACVQALQLVAPEMDVFLDAPRLRSSERWRERIEREAGRRERLFLFWSSAAAESPWVDFEWRLMLRRGGLGAIDAVLLEPPGLAPLPLELADLAPAEVRVKGGWGA